jgi:hypothetical protein
MPRRKITTINLKDLKSYHALIDELRNNPAYADKDLTTLKLTVFDSYEAIIKEVDKAINRLQCYVAARKDSIETFQGEQIISRVHLAKMLGISRQTLTSWINKGFITPYRLPNMPDIETFNTDTVLQELNRHKSERKRKKI